MQVRVKLLVLIVKLDLKKPDAAAKKSLELLAFSEQGKRTVELRHLLAERCIGMLEREGQEFWIWNMLYPVAGVCGGGFADPGCAHRAPAEAAGIRFDEDLTRLRIVDEPSEGTAVLESVTTCPFIAGVEEVVSEKSTLVSLPINMPPPLGVGLAGFCSSPLGRGV